MADKSLRILIIGGYGAFGGRLTRILADEEGLTLLVAGRSKAKAEAFCRSVTGRGQVLPAFFDRDADVAAMIADLHPDIMVDASGPFQEYGEAQYRIVEASLAAGVDYIDLADATDFVCGIGRFDRAAQERNCFVISGASTYPALTGAVIRHLATDLAAVVGIEAGTAPTPHARVGLSFISALAGYAGRPLRLLRDGQEITSIALVDSRWHVIAPPGAKPLGPRLLSLVDVPELKLLPQAWPELKSVWLGGGIAPTIQHRMFILLARLSSTGLLPFLARLAPLLHWLRGLATWGADRGGMYVVVDGVHEGGTAVRREWDLIAEGDDGPFIPAMAAAAIIRHCRNGHRPAAGARSTLHELSYADFEYFFQRKNIVAGVRDLPGKIDG